MQSDLKNHELLSALVDGQLDGQEFAATVEWVGAEEDARLSWQTYHLVGEVLRSGEAMAGAGDVNFVRRLKPCLEQEAPIGRSACAPDLTADYQLLVANIDINRRQKNGVNDPVFRWKLAAGAASLGVVMMISWQALSDGSNAAGVSQLVQVPVLSSTHGFALQQVPVDAGEQPQVMIRDAHLDALLTAHRQFGGTSALQMPAGFLRNATFEGVSP